MKRASLTWVIPFIIANICTLITADVPHYGCFGNNYTNNSLFSTNLLTLLSSLPSNMDSTGFYNASLGQAYASALCRTDIQLRDCRACVQDAIPVLLTWCPNRRQGVHFRGDCTLRYSDESMFGILSDGYTIWGPLSSAKVSSPDRFNEDLRTLLEDLSGQAASGGSDIKIGAGSRRAPDFQTVFALLQCMPDLSMFDCDSCLIGAQNLVCCGNWSGMVIYKPSCTLQYNLQPFFNMTRIEEARAMVASPPPLPPVVAPPPPVSLGNNNGDHGGNKTPTVIIIVVPVVVSLLIAASVGYYVTKRAKKSKQVYIRSKDDDDDQTISAEESLLYDFSTIRAATNDFSGNNKLGEGGFGSVYKGKLENGQEIAVKRLSENSGQGDIEFKNEVLLMAKLQHRNLVRLLGFSIQRNERLLVYELVQNSSLDTFIFDPVRRLLIDWNKRYKIILGIARGLLYLHEDSTLRIVHRDLKASNILLDREMNPKIADFGMARLFMQDESRGNTRRIVGTYGYMPPEYARNGQFSVKLDVFSFGVLILEIISGQKNYSFQDGENKEYMLSFAWKNWRDGTAMKMMDPVLLSNAGCTPNMLRCIHIGLLCVQDNAESRPTMASVVLMLNSQSITLPVPSRPAYCSPTSDPNSRQMKTTVSTCKSSRNDASFTEMCPR